MVDPTSSSGRSRAYRSERARIEELMAENLLLREQLEALTREYAGVTGLIATARGISDLAESITGLTNMLYHSMGAVVDGMVPLKSLEALVPERTWEPLQKDQAMLLEGLQVALARPDFGSPEGLSKIPDSPRRGIFEQGMEAAG